MDEDVQFASDVERELREMGFRAVGSNAMRRLVAGGTLVLAVLAAALLIFMLPEIFWSLPAPLRSRRAELVLACLAGASGLGLLTRARIIVAVDATADRCSQGAWRRSSG